MNGVGTAPGAVDIPSFQIRDVVVSIDHLSIEAPVTRPTSAAIRLLAGRGVFISLDAGERAARATARPVNVEEPLSGLTQPRCESWPDVPVSFPGACRAYGLRSDGRRRAGLSIPFAGRLTPHDVAFSFRRHPQGGARTACAPATVRTGKPPRRPDKSLLRGEMIF
jgi:hypothetical protein